jgi:hypothetical protein
MDCWGVILSQLDTATDVLNLSVVCRLFYSELKQSILNWITNRYNIERRINIGRVHDYIYMYHLSELGERLLINIGDYTTSSSPDTHVFNCWYIDPVNRTAVPLIEVNPMCLVFSDDVIQMALNILEEEKPWSWRSMVDKLRTVLSEHLFSATMRHDWKNIIINLLGYIQLPKVEARSYSRLEDVVMDNELLLHSKQCIVINNAALRMNRSEIEKIVTDKYCARECLTRSQLMHIELSSMNHAAAAVSFMR